MTDSVIAVVASHPDDEVLGLGATLARLASAGARIHPLILGTGDPVRGADARETLLLAASKAAHALGTLQPECHDFPDNRFDTVPQLDLNRTVEAFLARVQPTLVFTHWDNDRNVDHRRTHEAVDVATRPYASSVRRVYLFETPSSSEGARNGRVFTPTLYYAIGADHALAKREALNAYACEMRPAPHPRSMAKVWSLMETRGAECAANLAEAFEVLREVR